MLELPSGWQAPQKAAHVRLRAGLVTYSPGSEPCHDAPLSHHRQALAPPDLYRPA
jgi:hypothetical protein